MHKATVNLETDLVRQPQGRSDMPYVGIFAQRAKHRPNPIGITTVEIISVEEGILTVKGLDAINDTPVIDIKPYFPIFDKANAYTPEWVNELMKTYF
jgi:tRNA-Thr(GGU) m(6)t(6)A37 methyltransferase TsaA